MLQAIITFVGYLRKAGFTISGAEIESCLQALALIEPSRENFKQVLQCSFVKSQADAEAFSKLYHAFFSLQTHCDFKVRGSQESSFSYLQQHSAHTDGRGVGQSGAGGSSLCQALLSEDFTQIRKLINAALRIVTDESAAVNKETIHELLRKLKINLDWAMTEHQLFQKLDHQPDRLYYYQSLLHKVEMELELELVKWLARKDSTRTLERYAYSLNYRQLAFNQLSKEQFALVKKQVLKLGRRLAVRSGRRGKAAKRGQISMRYTVRSAFKTGGTVLKVVRRKKVPGKPELLLLCDLSNSVIQFSHFFLLLVHAMQKRFRSVRTMIFVDRLEDITTYIQKHDFPEVVEKSLFNSGISASGFSDFGRVFCDLYKFHSSLLKPKTTLIILGDAKNNWRPPRTEAFQAIAAKCDKVYWLNPRPRSTWFEEDSILHLYMPYINAVYECRNLEQLRVIAKQIF